MQFSESGEYCTTVSATAKPSWVILPCNNCAGKQCEHPPTGSGQSMDEMAAFTASAASQLKIAMIVD